MSLSLLNLGEAYVIKLNGISLHGWKKMFYLKHIKGNVHTLEYFCLIDWYATVTKRHSISNIWIALSVVYKLNRINLYTEM